MTLLLLVLGFLLLLALHVPVAFSLLIPSLVYIFASASVSLDLTLPRIVGTVDSFTLVAIPLFMLMGNLAHVGGMTDRLYDFAAAALGRIRGSLGYVNVAVSFGFSWMSGAAIADAGAMAKVEVPAMIKRGYDPGFSVGLTAASSIISPIMPPSIPAVIYAVTASVSLGAMLIAGIMPAVVVTVALCVWVWLHARGRPHLSPTPVSRSEIWSSFLRAVWIFPAPVILLGGILGGVFTPTEAAAVAVVYVLVVGFAQRGLTLRKCGAAFLAATETTASIMFIVGAASLFSWIVAYERGPAIVAEAMVGLTDSPFLFLLMANALLLVVGMVIDPASAILIIVPVLLPAASQYGIDAIQFGVIVILSLMIGLITPPVGLILYVLSSATGLSFGTVARGSLPFLIPLIAALLLVTFIPQVTLTLPQLVGF